MSCRVLFLTLFLGLVALVAPSPAATFVVTKETDDDGPCLAFDCALREAVVAANTLPGPDVIELQAGTYRLTLTSPMEEFGTLPLTGDLDILEDLEIRGDPTGPVIVDASLANDRVIQVIRGLTVISNVTLTGGNTSGGGGGIQAIVGSVTLVRSTITGNRTSFDGGAIYCGLSHVTIVESTISNNTADSQGGGIYSFGSIITPTSVTVVNSTLSGNFADSGAAFYAFGSADRRIINSTIADNTASTAIDGVLTDSISPSVMHWANTITTDDCGFVSLVLTSGGGNMESPGASCEFPDPTDQMNVPDLLLGPLADNGGPTMTHALLPGSPAIDAGVAGECPATDQRGASRPQDGDLDGVVGCDAGAFEFGRLPTVIPTLSKSALIGFVTLLALAALIEVRRSL